VDYIEKISVKAKQQNASQIIGNLIVLNAPNIIQSVRKRWLIGESVLGGVIGEYSSSPLGQEYKAYKISLNPSANGTVDLTLTGALGAGLAIKKATQNDYKIFSVDRKYNMIGAKYGFEEFGLTDLEWHEMSQELLTFALESTIKKIYE